MIYSEQGLNKLFTFVSNVVVNVLELSFFDFFKKLVLIFSAEGVISLKHHIVQNTQWPHVSINRTMIDFGHDLRGHVSWSSAKSVNGFIFWAP